MPIIHIDPFAGLRLFDDPFARTGRPWSPAVDIYETDNALVLKADVPDVDLKDLDIQVEDHTLTVKGERKHEREEASKGYHRIERSYGSFVRRFTIPETVDTENISAELNHGVLSVSLPKKEAAKPKQVKVEVRG